MLNLEPPIKPSRHAGASAIAFESIIEIGPQAYRKPVVYIKTGKFT
jgi:hypothetical protein